jgi:hypothetical protein
VDYFKAVQEGRRRVNEALGILQEVAGPSFPMLFLKLGLTDWTPVGEEMLQKTVPGKGETAALVICDSEGNSKAMSAFGPVDKISQYSKSLELKGIPEFGGEVKLPL